MKIGMSTCCAKQGKVTEEFLENYKKAGIDAAEISMAGALYADFPYSDVAKWAERVGVELWSFHLPFAPFDTFNIANLDPDQRRGCLEILAHYIKVAGDMGIGRAVIHPSGEPIDPKDRPRSMELAKAGLATLADVAQGAGVRICVEDLPRTCLGHSSLEMEELLSADSRLRVCFDTNHLTEESPYDFARRMGDRIETVHVSDYDFKDERHWLPGEGLIDWTKLMDTLDEIGYKGVFMYELGFEGNPKTITRPRPLTCEDFRRNAEELFARKPLSVLAKGREDL